MLGYIFAGFGMALLFKVTDYFMSVHYFRNCPTCGSALKPRRGKK